MAHHKIIQIFQLSRANFSHCAGNLQ